MQDQGECGRHDLPLRRNNDGRRPPPRSLMPSHDAISSRRRRNFTKAGPVTVTRADGTREVQPAYSSTEVDRVIEEGRSRPQTFDEAPVSSTVRLAELGDSRYRRR